MLKAKSLAVFGLLIAILGVAAPIAWDVRQNAYELSIFIHSRTLLIKKSEGIDGLKVTLREREIDKLFSTEISIENTGRKLIAKDDIIRPLVLSFPDSPILGMSLKEKFPENLDYSARLISPTEMQVEFDVLNRGEKIVFNILSDKYPKIISGAIRAKNFSKLDIRDLQATSPYYEKIPSHVFYVTALSSLFLLFGISFAKKEFGPLRRDAYKISEALSPGFNKEQLKESLKKNIWDKLSEAQQALLEKHIHRIDPFDAEATQKLADTIRNEALNQDASGIIFIGALFSIIGLVYSFVRFILIATA